MLGRNRKMLKTYKFTKVLLNMFDIRVVHLTMKNVL